MTLTTTDAGTAARTWVRVCSIEDLEVERGRAALLAGIHGDVQVALFLLRDGTIHAVSNHDPYSGANVMSRGIVGTRGDGTGGEVPTVASPMYKQVFDLRTGACLDPQGKDERSLRVWPVGRRESDIYLRWED